MILTCSQCEREFKSYPSYAKRGQKYCSRDCAAEAGRVSLTCEQCGKQFKRIKGRVTPYKHHYCSEECRCEAERRPIPHGTLTGYGRGCRCGPCRNANRLSAQRWRKKQHENIPHGTVSGYRNYGCRCAPCSEVAARDHQRWYRAQQARKAAS